MKCDDNVCKRCLNIKSSTNIIYCCFLPLLNIPTQASSLSFNDFSCYIQFYVFITCTLYISLHAYVLSCFSCVQFRVTLWNIYSPPGSFVHGILQARILEWVVIPSSGGSSRPKDGTHISYILGRFFPTSATWEACMCVCVCVCVCVRARACMHVHISVCMTVAQS